MILKDIDPKTTNHKMSEAGVRAEKQMAFYLNRAFGEDEKVHVINDLRLPYNGEFAQFDHLVIHEFGFIAIESKSVSTKLSVNEQGEWVRHYRGQKGMKSPVNQARLQLELLASFLKSTDEFSLKNRLGLKVKIYDYAYDVFVAISDEGIIERELDIPEVKKADQVCDAIRSLIKSYDGMVYSLKTLKVPNSMGPKAIEDFANFLYVFRVLD